MPSLLEGIAGEIAQVSGDGAYDTFACHEAIAHRGAAATIPHLDIGEVAYFSLGLPPFLIQNSR